MKINRWMIIVACVAVLAAMFLGYRACRLSHYKEKATQLEGQVAVLTEQAKLKDIDYEKLKGESEKKIGELNGAIDSAYTVIAAKDETIKVLRGENAVTDAENERLRTQVQPVIDANPALKKYVEGILTVSLNKDRIIFTLEQKVAEKDKIIFSLTEKYNIEHKLRLEAEVSRDGWKAVADKLAGEVRAKDEVLVNREVRGAWRFCNRRNRSSRDKMR